jgi:membrane protein required for colicin V production
VNWVDLIVLVVLALFGLRGFFRGLFREIFSVIGLIAGFMLAVTFDHQVANYIAGHWKLSPLFLKGSAFILIFFLVYFGLSLIGWLLHRSEKLLFLQTLNRSGGVVIGLGKGATFTALAIFLIISTNWLPEPARERFAASYLVVPLSHLAENLVRIGKEKFFSDEGSAQVPAPNGNRL